MPWWAWGLLALFLAGCTHGTVAGIYYARKSVRHGHVGRFCSEVGCNLEN